MPEIRILPFVTRGKMSYGIWAFWLPMSVLLLFVNVTAQPGFLSIDCGGKRNHSAQNSISWVTDANYIDVGEIAEIEDVSQDANGSHLHNLRFFPKPLKKSCYQLPVVPNVPYLLRGWFAIGKYSGFKQLRSFVVSIETLGMLASINITAPYDDPTYEEIIFVNSGRVLYVCLIRTSESDNPFINAIELRTLQDGMYRQAQPGTLLLTYDRVDLGAKSTVR
jgi:hypothetical protein